MSFRIFLVMFLLAAVYLLFIIVLWRAGIDFFTLAIIAAVLLLIQYFYSDKLILLSMGAREVGVEEAPELHALVERISATTDLPKPKVAVINSRVPNAFATGRNPQNAVVAVSTSLLDKLDPSELQSVLAHEFTHIKNRDVAVMTIAGFFAAIAAFISRALVYGGVGGAYGRGRSREGGAGGVMLVWAVSLAAWVISFFLIRALSRYREFAADRGSAVITGSPAHLASALLKISGEMDRIPDRDLREVQGMNALFIVPALRRSSLLELFSTHPSIEKRLERLTRMEREMEQL